MANQPSLEHIVTKSGARYYPPLAQQPKPEPVPVFRPRNDSTSPWRWENPRFTFIDLFAGIGGLRIAFESEGGECVFSSEWNEEAQKTYLANFGETPGGDIREIRAQEIPAHDILVAGFPCQPFSIAGVSKKNSLGREHGFKDEAQGALFFEIVRILAHHAPRAFVLENVKNLRSHDAGRTYAIIIKKLQELGYHIFDKVLDARAHVPQHRERIFIVGLREFKGFDFPSFSEDGPRLNAVLEDRVPDKYLLTEHLWKYLQEYAAKHRAKGNGFGCTVTRKDGVARTLSARYYKDGSEILVETGRAVPRRLTPRECARLMGFPDDFKIVCSDTQAYKQFGNAVVVPVAREVARCLIFTLGLMSRTRGLRKGGSQLHARKMKTHLVG